MSETRAKGEARGVLEARGGKQTGRRVSAEAKAADRSRKRINHKTNESTKNRIIPISTENEMIVAREDGQNGGRGAGDAVVE